MCPNIFKIGYSKKTNISNIIMQLLYLMKILAGAYLSSTTSSAMIHCKVTAYRGFKMTVFSYNETRYGHTVYNFNLEC